MVVYPTQNSNLTLVHVNIGFAIIAISIVLWRLSQTSKNKLSVIQKCIGANC